MLKPKGLVCLQRCDAACVGVCSSAQMQPMVTSFALSSAVLWSGVGRAGTCAGAVMGTQVAT